MKCKGTTVAILAIVFTISSTRGEEKTKVHPSAAHLVKVASLRLPDEEVNQPFLIRAAFDLGEVSYGAAMGWRNPHQVVAILFDLRDQSPLAISVGKQTVIYDPIKMTLHSAAGTSLSWLIKNTEEEFQARFEFEFGRNNHLVDLDFESIFRGISPDAEVAKLDGRDQAYSLTAATDFGVDLRAVIELGSSMPLRQLELANEEAQVTISFVLDELQGRFPDAFFTFPADGLAGTDLPMETVEQAGEKGELSAENFRKLGDAIGFASLARAAIDEPRLREHALLSDVQINWDEIAKQDAKITGKLREIFRTQLETLKIQQGGADQPATALDLKAEGKEEPNLESEGRSQ